MRGGKMGNQKKEIFDEPSYAEKRSVVGKPTAQPEGNKEAKDAIPSETQPSLFRG